METKKIYRLVSFCVITFFFWSCSKIEKDTRNFMNEGRWTFEDLLSDGDFIDNLPYWDIESCGNTDSYCPGTWTHANGSVAQFYWNFQNNSGNFDFYLSPELKVDKNKATQQCDNLSGEYEVISSSSKEFILESVETKGYPGTLIHIRMVSE